MDCKYIKADTVLPYSSALTLPLYFTISDIVHTFSDLYCFFFRFFSWFWIMNFSLNVQWVNNTNTYSDMKIVLPQNIFELIVWGTSFPVQREKDMVDFRRNGARFSKKMLDTLQKHNTGTVQCWGLLNIAIFFILSSEYYGAA